LKNADFKLFPHGVLWLLDISHVFYAALQELSKGWGGPINIYAVSFILSIEGN